MTPQNSASASAAADLFDHALIHRLAGGGRFVERAWLRDLITTALDDDACRIVLVTGAPGAGKSTLLAWLAVQEPTWPRYFIRRAAELDSDFHQHEGGLASFLTVIGLQLAALWGDLVPDPELRIESYIQADEVVGEATGARIREVVLNPFQSLARQLVMRVGLDIGRVVGSATGLEIGRLILDANQQPQALVEPALLGPARRLAELHPDQQIVILIDGLDELHFRTAASDVGQWLAELQQLPSNVRFIVSSRPDERVRELEVAHADAVRVINVDPGHGQVTNYRVAEDITRYAELIAEDGHIAAVLASHGIHTDRFVREAAAKAEGNFQYLTFLARTLESAPDRLAPPSGERRLDPAGELDWLLNVRDLPDGLPRLYEHFLLRVYRHVTELGQGPALWDSVYRAVLGLLAVARAPLTGRQLETLGGIPRSGHGCAAALAAFRQFLDRDASGGYHFYHGSVADFVLTPPGGGGPVHCQPADWHKRLAERARQAHAANGSWKSADPYLRRYLALHAAQVGLLDGLLEDPRFLLGAEPVGILETLYAASRAKPIARMYRQIVTMVRDGDEAAALAHLELYARQEGLGAFGAAVAAMSGTRPWSILWAHWLRGRLRQHLGEHGAEVTAMAVAKVRGKPVAISGGVDGRLLIWDLTDDKLAATLQHGHGGDRYSTGITALATGELPSGEPILVSGGRDGTAQVWNLEKGRPIGAPLAGAENAGSVIAVGSVGADLLAVCAVGASARVWDVGTKRAVGPPVNAEGEVAAVARVSGQILFAVGNRVFDATTGKPLGPPIPFGGLGVCATALGELDGLPLVALSDRDGSVSIWNPVTGDRFACPLQDRGWRSYALSIGWLADRLVLAIGLPSRHEEDCQVWLWDIAGHDWVGDTIVLPRWHELSAITLTESAGSFHMICAGTERAPDLANAGGEFAARNRPHPAVRTWRLAVSGRPESLVPVPGPTQPDREFKSIAVLSGKGRPLIVGGGPYLTWWDQATGWKPGSSLGVREGAHSAQSPVDAIAVSEVAGQTVAICGAGQTVRVWKVSDGMPWREPLTGDPGATSGERDIAGVVIGHLDHRPVVAYATHRDGIRIWDLCTGDPVGARFIEFDEYIHSLAAAVIDGQDVLLIGTFSTSRGVHIRDLATGSPTDFKHPGHSGQLSGLVVADRGGQPIIVSAAPERGTIRVWDPAGPPAVPLPYIDLYDEDPSLIKADAHIGALAVIELDGQLVAVHSGYRGLVDVTDLTGAIVQPSLASPTTGVAIADMAGGVVAVCGGDDGIQVLDLETGEEAYPSPPIDRGPDGPVQFSPRLRISAVAVTELDGRAIGVYRGPASINAWYIDTGEPTAMRPLCYNEVVSMLAVGKINDRTVILHSTDRAGDTVEVTDPETGQPACEHATNLHDKVTAAGTARLADADVLVYARSGDVRARYLTEPEISDEQLEWLRREQTGALDETPPERPRIGQRLTGEGSGRLAMTLGEIEGIPVVISGHESGWIDVFTVETAARVGERIGRHPGRITALAYGELFGWPIVISGDESGIVCLWALGSGQLLTSIHTLGWVTALAIARSDRIVVATKRGTVAVRLNPDGLPELPSSSGTGTSLQSCGRGLRPVIVRSARACARHDHHVELGEIGGEPALRVCIKGVQKGSPQFYELTFGQGHCYVFPGRIVITERDRPDDDPSGLKLFLRRASWGILDTPHAYQYDGCHFGLVLEQPSTNRTICCYSRADRDLLVAGIEGASDAKPKRPLGDL